MWKHTINAAILVDQINVCNCSLALHRHLLQLVDNILERPTSGQGTIGGNHIGIVACGRINDGLVVQLINLSVEGHGSSLLELDVVLNTGAVVEKVGNHGGIRHPIRNGGGKIGLCGSLAIGNASASTGLRTSNWLIRAILSSLCTLDDLSALLLLLALLLSALAIGTATLDLGEGSSIDCRAEK